MVDLWRDFWTRETGMGQQVPNSMTDIWWWWWWWQILSRNPPTEDRPGARPAYIYKSNTEKMKTYDHAPNGIQNRDSPGARSVAQTACWVSYCFVNTAFNHLCTHIVISSTTHEESFLPTGVSSTPLSRTPLDNYVTQRPCQNSAVQLEFNVWKTFLILLQFIILLIFASLLGCLKK